jgi:dienelactone hydrolase
MPGEVRAAQVGVLTTTFVRTPGPNEPSSDPRRLGVHIRYPLSGDDGGKSSALPILIYAHGWGGRAEENSELLQMLAARGFLVVGIESGRLSGGSLDFSSETSSVRTRRMADRAVVVQANDAVAVLETLIESDGAIGQVQLPKEVAARIDRERAGILGYSFGGAAAAEAARLDQHFGAVLNLDGWLFGEAANAGFPAIYMLITDTLTPPSADDLAATDPARRGRALQNDRDIRQQRRQLARYGGYAIEIRKAGHGSFTDASGGMLRRVLTPADEEIRKIVRRYACAFFAQHLRGEDEGLLRAEAPQPGIRVTVWPPARQRAVRTISGVHLP